MPYEPPADLAKLSLADLAEDLGINAVGLTETVNRWNAFVDAGDDAAAEEGVVE